MRYKNTSKKDMTNMLIRRYVSSFMVNFIRMQYANSHSYALTNLSSLKVRIPFKKS